VTALRQALAGAPARAVERTVVMAPPVVATTPPSQPWSPAASPPTVDYSAELLPQLRAMGVGGAELSAPAAVPAPATTPSTSTPAVKPRSHKRRNILIAAGVLIVLVVVFFVYAAANAKPTLSLSSSTVVAGDTVVVTAGGVPANQNGEIELLSSVHTFPFHADANGNISVPILVPRNIGAGDHIVKICWAAQCRASSTLHVTDPVGLATPSPIVTPTTTPNATPHPTATPSPVPEISISNYNIKRSTGTETVYGIHFAPGTTVTISFVQGTATNKTMGTQTVSSSGYFTLTFTVPSSAAPGPAAVRVCGTAGCQSATVNVTS
jgi:hypothetical protein